ncbi:hypothetical protein BJ166DRAFT_117006 [Pestalotiopsis sp. NC0098]|nr:hypothetical protein BJ166DRAFT_117006 [Pestalotiopsis sp. NC0098]
MIGSRPNTAVPTIMVSCLNKSVREEAVKAIKASRVLQDHPEYSFGASALPLNEPVPSQSLGSPEDQSSVIFQSPLGAENHHHKGTPSDTPASMLTEQEGHEIMAASSQPSIGRRLFLADSKGKPLRCATGGVVLRIGDVFYQRTVGHINEKREDTTLLHNSDDLNYCYLEEDANSDDEGERHPPDHEVTSRGSLSPIPERLSLSGLSDAGSDSDAVMTDAPAADPNTLDISSAQSNWQDVVQRRQSDGYPCSDSQKCSTLLNTGQLRHHCRDGNNAHLDYGLVFLNRGFDLQSLNEVEVDQEGTSTSLRVHTVAKIQDMEKDIIVVTASNGTTRGKLVPSALYLRSSTQPSLEELFVVHLQGQIMDGDCGAEVLDAQTCDLYGHVVRGCSGTQVAYIRAATDVFEDIQQRLGIVPVIATQDDGKVVPEHSKPFDSMIITQQQSDDTHRNVPSAGLNSNSRDILFACPFAKKDPIAHEHCNNYDLKEIKHVKQHLKRCHLIVICPRCRTGFNSQDLLDEHLLPQVCEIRNGPDPEGMTQMQHNIIKPRMNHKISLEDQWYFIWDTLFPGITRPTTIYKEASISPTGFHRIFQDFYNQRIPALANQILHEMENETPSLSPYDRAVFIMNRGLLELTNTLERAEEVHGGYSIHHQLPSTPPPPVRPHPTTPRNLQHPRDPQLPVPPAAHSSAAAAAAQWRDVSDSSTIYSYDSGYYSASSATGYSRGQSRFARASDRIIQTTSASPFESFATDEDSAMFSTENDDRKER